MAQYVFPKVDIAPPKKSNRDLSLYKVADVSVGPLFPILSMDVLPGDWMKIKTNAVLETLPMVGPIKGRWKMSFDYFLNPWSNIYGFMDNNTKLTTDQIINMPRWRGVLCSRTFIDVGELDAFNTLERVQRGSLLDYLGCPVGFMGQTYMSNGEIQVASIDIPLESYITYMDIVRNYYVNNQDDIVPVITGYGEEGVINVDQSVRFYTNLSLSDIDKAIMTFRYESSFYEEGTKFVDGLEPRLLLEEDGIRFWIPYNSSLGLDAFTFEDTGVVRYGRAHNNMGLCLRTYRMDLLRGIMNDSVGSYDSFVDTGTDGGFDVTTLYFANKLQTLINRLDITGGRVCDWIKTRWSVDAGIEVDRPIYLGSHSTWIDTTDVIATGAGQSGSETSANPNSQLGQQVAFGVGSIAGGRPITFKASQYGTLMCIFSIVPDVVYSQGFELNMLKTKFSDIYDPAFSQIGYQDVLRYELSALPQFYGQTLANTQPTAENRVTESVGKRVAWAEYMASLNRVHGNFAYGGTFDYWVNNRTYTNRYDRYPLGSEPDQTEIQANNILSLYGAFDDTTYIEPDKWNGIFANQSFDANNWLLSVRFDIEASRPIGSRLMPHM